MSKPIIDAMNIRKKYGDHTVLDGLSMRVKEGTVAALLGPNGAGKTTLVNILSTLVRPDEGRAIVAGHDVLAHPQAVRRTISLTGQYAAVDELLTGEENLKLAARLWRVEKARAQPRVEELLERFELTRAARKPVKTYSGGMRRKLDLAMSLIGEPRLLFLDEPTTGLDPRSRSALWDIVRELARTGVTVFLTTQYLEEADQLADRITMIAGGRVIAEGAADELKAKIAQPEVELWFENDAALGLAASRLGQPTPITGGPQRMMRVPTDGSTRHVHELLGQLLASNVPVERVALRQPSLDDVFIRLTDDDPEKEEMTA